MTPIRSYWSRCFTKTPTILQMDTVECGAVALGIVLAYHGRYEPLIRLRDLCGVSRDGCKASNILSAARTFGLQADACKAEPDQLRQMRGPFIVFWELNHFVVVERVARDTVYINDPATGRRTVSWQEFDRSFTGIVLRLEKGPAFQPGGCRRSVWRSLGQRLFRQTPALAYLVVAMVALAFLTMIAASYPGILIDRVLLGGMTGWLKPLLGALSATALVIWLVALAQHRVLLRMQTRIAGAGSSRFIWHLFRLPMRFFGQRSRAEVGTRVFANDELALLLSGELATSVAGLLVAALFLVLMFRYSAALTGIAVAVALGNLAALQFSAAKRTDRNRKLTQQRAKLTSATFDGLLSIESLKSMGCEGVAFTRWTGQQAKILNAAHEVEASSRLTRIVSPLLMAIGAALILGLGGSQIMSGSLTLGALIAFQGLTRCFLEPMDSLVRIRGQFNDVQANLDRLDDVLEHPAETAIITPSTQVPSTQANQRLSGAVELRHVTFGYNPLGPAQITDFNLTIPTGSRVAIVGASGSGKSTISRLVTGLCTPWSGEILFDGIARESVDRHILADSLVAVDQEVVLFEDTIAENIRLWDATICDQALIQAAEDAAIHEDIMCLPGAYDFQLEESGRNLSGGQRQRIEIARALATSPRILVLDEATSALDPGTEKFITDRIRRRGCTCLVIAHRLSTIRDCDEIVVLDGGRIVERGTHESLLGRRGKYARLIAESAHADDPAASSAI